MNAAECRKSAQSFRERSDSAKVLRRLHLLRNISHSLSCLATQLDALEDDDRQLSQAKTAFAVVEGVAEVDPALKIT
jgi:hypothetical protein